MNKIKKMTNEELRSALAEYGEDVGPVTTLKFQKLYQKRLRKLRHRDAKQEKSVSCNDTATTKLTNGKNISKIFNDADNIKYADYSDGTGVTSSEMKPIISRNSKRSTKSFKYENGGKNKDMQNCNAIDSNYQELSDHNDSTCSKIGPFKPQNNKLTTDNASKKDRHKIRKNEMKVLAETSPTKKQIQRDISAKHYETENLGLQNISEENNSFEETMEDLISAENICFMLALITIMVYHFFTCLNGDYVRKDSQVSNITFI